MGTTKPKLSADDQARADLVEELVIDFSGYAVKISRHFARGLDFMREELEGEALLELVRLARKHVENPYPNFKGIISHAVGLRMAWRMRHERRRNVAAFRRAGDVVGRDGDRSQRVAVLPDPRPTRQRERERDADGVEGMLDLMFGLLDRLPERESELLIRVFCEGVLATEIARECGVRLSAISRRIWRAVKKLRRMAGVQPRGPDHLGRCVGVRADSIAKTLATKRRKKELLVGGAP